MTQATVSMRQPVFTEGNFPDPTMELVYPMEGGRIFRESNDSRTVLRAYASHLYVVSLIER